jgi:NNP family nitrate/nitrite transporter-like MFS transporter
VAVPVVVGSLGRIPVGALTDRFGGRLMFPAVSFSTFVPVLFIGYLGHSSLAALLIGGFFGSRHGLRGRRPVRERLVPAGSAGSGDRGLRGRHGRNGRNSALTTVKLVTAHAVATPFLVMAIVLAVYGGFAAIVLRDAPGRQVPSTDPCGAARPPPDLDASPLTSDMSASFSARHRARVQVPPRGRADAWPAQLPPPSPFRRGRAHADGVRT